MNNLDKYGPYIYLTVSAIFLLGMLIGLYDIYKTRINSEKTLKVSEEILKVLKKFHDDYIFDERIDD